MLRSVVWFAIVVASLLGRWTEASTHYEQPPMYPGAYDSRVSQHDATFNAQTFDDFTLTSTSTISSVAWQGLYVANSAMAQPAPPPTATHFYVGFLADNQGFPGDLIVGRHYPVAEVGQTLLAEVPFGLAGGTQTTAAIYEYRLNVSPFIASEATRYWILVQAATPDFDVFWGWSSGGGGDSRSLQHDSGVITEYSTDRSFALESDLLFALGDFDEDSDVDGKDVAEWRAGFGMPAGASHGNGDADGDGDVDGRDFLYWQQQFEPQAVAAAIPEPHAQLLSLAAIAATLAHGRHRRRRELADAARSV
jgi:hypothetical protein